MIPATAPQPRRGRVGPGVALAVAAALLGGISITANSSSAASPHQRATPAAAGHHRSAASVTAVHRSDGGGTTWIPAERSGQWELTRPDLPDASKTEKADCAAFAFFQTGTVSTRAADGSWTVVQQGGLPTCAQGSWSIYRPAFAAALPTEPTALLAAMRASGFGTSDADTFVTGLDFIAAGWVEPRVVANVVAALKLIPGVTVTRGVPNGAGATGDAISFAGRVKATVPERWTVIVDPGTDRVIATAHSYPGGADHDTLTYRTVGALGATR